MKLIEDRVKETNASISRKKYTHELMKGKLIYQKQVSDCFSPSNQNSLFNSSSFGGSQKLGRSSSQFQKSANAYEGSALGLYNNDSVWGQSASTWLHTSHAFGFGKGSERFKNDDKYEKLTLQTCLNEVSDFYINLPSTNTSRSCTLGKGQKQIMFQYQLKNAKENPPPGHSISVYQKPTHQRNISLGTSQRFYKPQNVNPGPGSYNIIQQPGKEKKVFSLKSRIEDPNFNRLNMDRLSPNHYTPNESLQQTQKFANITFGKGQKMSFTIKSMKDNPGPIYKLPSPFDKFNKGMKNWVSPLIKIKQKEQQQQLQKQQNIKRKPSYSSHYRSQTQRFDNNNQILA